MNTETVTGTVTGTVPETFDAAVQCVANFAQRFKDGNVSTTDIEDADITLIGLRRLLADWRTRQGNNNGT